MYNSMGLRLIGDISFTFERAYIQKKMIQWEMNTMRCNERMINEHMTKDDERM